MINRKFLRSKVVPILEGTRKEIQDKIAAKDDVHQDIFDAAQVLLILIGGSFKINRGQHRKPIRPKKFH